MELEQTLRQQITFLVSEIEVRAQVEPDVDLTKLLAELDDLNGQLEVVVTWNREMACFPLKLARQTCQDEASVWVE